MSYCENCGGSIIYISSLNKEVCDACEYEKEEVM